MNEKAHGNERKYGFIERMHEMIDEYEQTNPPLPRRGSLTTVSPADGVELPAVPWDEINALPVERKTGEGADA